MKIELGLLKGQEVNTHYAGLAALAAHYQQNNTLRPLKMVDISMKTVDHPPVSKLQQVWLSILAGCEYVSEVNTSIRPDRILAQVWHLDSFAEQSTLSRTLDRLTLTNIDQLRDAVRTIWRQSSQIQNHDWRGFLWLDFDLSGLPCGKGAEESTKGYFSGKKTSPDAS